MSAHCLALQGLDGRFVEVEQPVLELSWTESGKGAGRWCHWLLVPLDRWTPSLGLLLWCGCSWAMYGLEVDSRDSSSVAVGFGVVSLDDGW